jgi:hypothetical protein
MVLREPRALSTLKVGVAALARVRGTRVLVNAATRKSTLDWARGEGALFRVKFPSAKRGIPAMANRRKERSVFSSIGHYFIGGSGHSRSVDRVEWTIEKERNTKVRPRGRGLHQWAGAPARSAAAGSADRRPGVRGELAPRSGVMHAGRATLGCGRKG